MKNVKDRCEKRGLRFTFTLVQARTKFKSCVGICKRAAMLQKNGSGLKNFIEQKGYGDWFTKLFPPVESRNSYNPELGIEPSFLPSLFLALL